MTKPVKNITDENETVDWIVTTVVEPALKGIEDTKLVTFEYKEKKIEFNANKENGTELSIKIKFKRKHLKKEIADLMSLFLARFELYGKGSYRYKIQNYKNLKTGGMCVDIPPYEGKSIDRGYEKYIQKIDKAIEKDDKIATSMSAFHYAAMAISPNHAYLSVTNAFHPLIEDIGKENRTSLSGLNACWKLFEKDIIKKESEREHWVEELRWIHNTIDKIRYENMQVGEEDMKRIKKSYEEFLDMYILYKQQ